MLKYILILISVLVSESKGSFPCPIRKTILSCEKAGCYWEFGNPRSYWYPPWLWVSQNRCKWESD